MALIGLHDRHRPLPLLPNWACEYTWIPANPETLPRWMPSRSRAVGLAWGYVSATQIVDTVIAFRSPNGLLHMRAHYDWVISGKAVVQSP